MAEPNYQPFTTFSLSDALGKAQNVEMGQYRVGEAKRAVMARNALQNALQKGTPEAMESFKQQFPQEAMQYENEATQSQLAKMHVQSAQMGMAGQLAYGVHDEDSYQRALQLGKKMGLDLSNAPAHYDPSWVQQTVGSSMQAKDRLDMMLRQAQIQHYGAEQNHWDAMTPYYRARANFYQQMGNRYGVDPKERLSQHMIDNGTPPELARGLAYGTVKQDPITGTWVNVASGKVVGKVDTNGNWVPGPGSQAPVPPGQFDPNHPETAIPPALSSVIDSARPGAAVGPAPTIPPGYKQIGTSGGKPVFDDGQGNRFLLGDEEGSD